MFAKIYTLARLWFGTAAAVALCALKAKVFLFKLRAHRAYA